MKERCPICGTDQHVYAGFIVNHDDGIIRCTGSRSTAVSEPEEPVSTVRKCSQCGARLGAQNPGDQCGSCRVMRGPTRRLK